MQTPHAKYPMPQFDKVQLTKPRPFAKKLEKQKPIESWRIPKMDGPAPGSYDAPRSYSSTQTRRPSGPPKATGKKLIFTDDYSKLKMFVPAPSQYKEIARGIKLQTKAKQLQTLRQ